MRVVIISSLILLAIALIVWSFLRASKSSNSSPGRASAPSGTAISPSPPPAVTDPSPKSTQEMINWLASEAVASAREVDGTALNYSPASIEKVERVLGKICDDAKRRGSQEGLNGLAMAYGAYIGECIRRNEQGVSWDRDHPTLGEKSYPLHWADGDAFPMNWCYGRLTNGDEDNVWHKYQVLKNQRTSKPGMPPE
jgi:hypothetical protein